MAPNHLETLWKRLNALQKCVNLNEGKTALEIRLADRKSISSADEKWLDSKANLINEQMLLDRLQKESHYEKVAENLNEAEEGMVRKLREMAHDLMKTVDLK